MKISQLTKYEKSRLAQRHYICTICNGIIYDSDDINMRKKRVGKTVLYSFSHASIRRCLDEQEAQKRSARQKAPTASY